MNFKQWLERIINVDDWAWKKVPVYVDPDAETIVRLVRDAPKTKSPHLLAGVYAPGQGNYIADRMRLSHDEMVQKVGIEKPYLTYYITSPSRYDPEFQINPSRWMKQLPPKTLDQIPAISRALAILNRREPSPSGRVLSTKNPSP